jgi:hypothetical protein
MGFYLSRKGEQVGPWSVDNILTKLESRELSWTDYLFDDSSKEWVLIMDHSKFSAAFKSWVQPGPIKESRPHTQPDPVLPKSSKNGRDWFILKDSNKHGPFDYLELVRMLQEKRLYEYDFVWSASLPQWQRIAEAEAFQAEKIKALQESSEKEIQEVFFRRRYARVSYGASLLVHDSRSVWKGQGLELSPGGAGIVVKEANLTPGQTLFLHFKAGDGVPPFNAICTVVSKQYVENVEGSESKEKAVRYGVKFTNISQSIQRAIRSYTDKAA